MSARDAPPAGMILIDKPRGMTSHDVVTWLRAGLGLRRIGHAGTLDPLASGLLPCLFGPATRLVDYLHGWSKTYVGTIVLGEETETGDAESAGARGPRASVSLPPRIVLERAASRLRGRQRQVPPSYSAKKVGGVAAHRLARRGVAPTLPSVEVTVHALRLAPRSGGTLAFAARVSSGTYIRALARDLGRLLGTGAYLGSLRRTGIGPLRVRDGLSPDDAVDRQALLARAIPPSDVPLPLARVELDEAQLARFRSGQRLDELSLTADAGARVAAIAPNGDLAGIGRVLGDGELHPAVVLHSGQ